MSKSNNDFFKTDVIKQCICDKMSDNDCLFSCLVSLTAVFLDVKQRSPKRTLLFGGAMRDIQKTAARETISCPVYVEFDATLRRMKNFSFSFEIVSVSRAFLVLFHLSLCNQDSEGADLGEFAIIISTFQFL